MARRGVALVLGVALAGVFGAPPVPVRADATLLDAAANSLIARHDAPPLGGWAWHSAIQGQHLQVDRDVGAASVGMGFLAAYETTGNSAYLNAASEAGTWLLAAAQPANGGLRWPDWHNDDGKVSPHHYSSFDDGAPGIADFLWRLWEATSNANYEAGAKAGMVWLESQARAPAGSSCPQTSCFWKWDDDKDPTVYTGMGEGAAGIAYAFDTFALETGDPSYEQYAMATANWLEAQIASNGAIPETPGTQGYDTGYLGLRGRRLSLRASLSAHGQYALAERRDPLEAWVRAQAQKQSIGGEARPIELGRDGYNPTLATGIEEGAAGIGWVELQLYALTATPTYLGVAESAGTWLLAVAQPMAGGVCWPEDYQRRIWHTSLDNGAPGIGWFLDDLDRADDDYAYETGALAAQSWLAGVAFTDNEGTDWGRALPGLPAKTEMVYQRRPVVALGPRRHRRLLRAPRRLDHGYPRGAARTLGPLENSSKPAGFDWDGAAIAAIHR